jgi:Histidine kinase-, DNA gyrase B-, and HSP90-like ATPase
MHFALVMEEMKAATATNRKGRKQRGKAPRLLHLKYTEITFRKTHFSVTVSFHQYLFYPYSMLRTFCSNPALGGFGGESSAPHDASAATPDAFCQIIKELVDNAVDACTVAAADAITTDKQTSKKGKPRDRANTAPAPAKRVRVVIERFEDNLSRASSDDNGTNNNEILRVTISDNGCGMSDIQACVGAFHSSKAHNTATAATTNGGAKNASKTTETSDLTTTAEAQTAGRYGIGLTLCLLHAQRLVPDSCASIQSAVSSDKEWTVMTAVVDTASDAVRCFPRESLAKGCATESGTAISILVPVRCSLIFLWSESNPYLINSFPSFRLFVGWTKCHDGVASASRVLCSFQTVTGHDMQLGSTSTDTQPRSALGTAYHYRRRESAGRADKEVHQDLK